MADYRFTSHRLKVNKDFSDKMEVALEVIGQVAEGRAKSVCSGFVDTGRLMNSRYLRKRRIRLCTML